MAIYQFRCEEHGYFEIKQGMMDNHIAQCPECGMWMRRVYTSAPFQFGKADYNKDGSRDLNPDLPHVPSGTKFTHGWTKKEEGSGN